MMKEINNLHGDIEKSLKNFKNVSVFIQEKVVDGSLKKIGKKHNTYSNW